MERDVLCALLSAAALSSRSHMLLKDTRWPINFINAALESSEQQLEPEDLELALVGPADIEALQSAFSRVRSSPRTLSSIAGWLSQCTIETKDRTTIRLEQCGIPKTLADAGIGVAVCFRVLHNRAVDSRFASRFEQFGSTYAFHGSGLHNWWSILRDGLDCRNDRGGGIYGPGVYLTTHAAVAEQFVEFSEAFWVPAGASLFARRPVGIFGGFEVIEDAQTTTRVNDGKYLVVSDPSAIRLRHLFVVVGPERRALASTRLRWLLFGVLLLVLLVFLSNRRTIFRSR